MSSSRCDWAGHRMLLPRYEPNIDGRMPIGCDATSGYRSAACGKQENRAAWRPGFLAIRIRPFERSLAQVEYLNSGIAFSSSLVALKMAWSGHQGFGFAVGAVDAAPVVVVEPGREPAPPLAGGALAAPV